MRIEIINTGAELLVGRVLNTHQQWLCRQLADLGYEVSRQVCVADDCQWAFYDTSKNRSRHWCSMGVCGNRQKTRTYRARQRARK